jgi:chromosome segregation ATPase
MPNLDLPDLSKLPTLDDSDRWNEYLDSVTEARKRRERLRERADELETEITELEEEIPELRVAVATADATEADLSETKSELSDLRDELNEIRETELPAQNETIQLLKDRRSEVKSEEGDKLAEEYAQVQRVLQERKKELLDELAQILDHLDELGSMKDASDVGSYRPDVPSVPPVHGLIKGQSRSDDVTPKRLRRRADELADTLETLGTTE